MEAYENARWGNRPQTEADLDVSKYERMSNSEIAEAIEKTYFETEMLNQEIEIAKLQIKNEVFKHSQDVSLSELDLRCRAIESEDLGNEIREYVKGKAYLRGLAAYVSLKGLDPMDI